MKAEIYLNIEVGADDKDMAEDLAVSKFAELIDKVTLPSPLEFESIEAWEVKQR
jgi:hypothetical protein